MCFIGNPLYCDDKSSVTDAFYQTYPVVLQSEGTNREAARYKSECGFELG